MLICRASQAGPVQLLIEDAASRSTPAVAEAPPTPSPEVRRALDRLFDQSGSNGVGDGEWWRGP